MRERERPVISSTSSQRLKTLWNPGVDFRPELNPLHSLLLVFPGQLLSGCVASLPFEGEPALSSIPSIPPSEEESAFPWYPEAWLPPFLRPGVECTPGGVC